MVDVTRDVAAAVADVAVGVITNAKKATIFSTNWFTSIVSPRSSRVAGGFPSALLLLLVMGVDVSVTAPVRRGKFLKPFARRPIRPSGT